MDGGALIKLPLKKLAVLCTTLSVLALSQTPVIGQTIQQTKQRLGAIAERASESNISTYFFVGKSCRLLFLGTRHTFDPQSPIFKIVDENWEVFSPTLLIVEGGSWKNLVDVGPTIEQQGEMGYLALRGRKGGIDITSFEPPEDDLKIAASRLHSSEDIKLYMLLRMVPQWRNSKTGIDIQSQATKYLGTQMNDKSRPLSISDVDQMVRKLFHQDSDWTQLDATMKINGIESNVIKKVDFTVNAIRNAKLIEAISQSIKEKRRVMIAAGNTHLGALLAELNQLESSCLN